MRAETERDGRHSSGQRRVAGRLLKRRPMLFVSHGRQKGCIILNRLPSEPGRVWIRYDQDGREVDVPVSEVKLIGLST